MNISLYHSIGTVSAFIAFLLVCWWAYTPRNRQRFEADGQRILDNDPIYAGQHGRGQDHGGKAP